MGEWEETPPSVHLSLPLTADVHPCNLDKVTNLRREEQEVELQEQQGWFTTSPKGVLIMCVLYKAFSIIFSMAWSSLVCMFDTHKKKMELCHVVTRNVMLDAVWSN